MTSICNQFEKEKKKNEGLSYSVNVSEHFELMQMLYFRFYNRDDAEEYEPPEWKCEAGWEEM